MKAEGKGQKGQLSMFSVYVQVGEPSAKQR